MNTKPRRKIGEILIEDGLLTKEKLAEALAIQEKQPALIGKILVDKGFITEESLLSALGKQFKTPCISLKNYSINPDMAPILKPGFCHKHLLVPFDCDHKKVYIAVSDPSNETVIEEIRSATGRTPQVFVARISEILNAIYFLHHEASGS